MVHIVNRLVSRSRLAAVVAALVLLSIVTSPAKAIIIRHDVDDAEYVQTDEAYPAVFDVFDQRGGVATLVAPQWALTVGHVGQDIPQGHQVTIAGQSYAIRQIVLHPDWETKRREMALLQLDRPVQGVEPIPVYEQGDEQD